MGLYEVCGRAVETLRFGSCAADTAPPRKMVASLTKPTNAKVSYNPKFGSTTRRRGTSGEPTERTRASSSRLTMPRVRSRRTESANARTCSNTTRCSSPRSCATACRRRSTRTDLALRPRGRGPLLPVRALVPRFRHQPHDSPDVRARHRSIDA